MVGWWKGLGGEVEMKGEEEPKKRRKEADKRSPYGGVV
jgi:hypothetical protein